MMSDGSGVHGYALAAIDLDGTLLRGDGSVSARTRRSIRAAARAGILPVIVTARPPRITRGYCDALELSGFAICCNGAMTYDPQLHAVVEGVVIEADVVEALVVELRSAMPGLILGWERALECGCEEGFALEGQFGGRSAVRELPRGDVAKLVLHHPRLDQRELRTMAELVVGEAATVLISDGVVVEVTARGVDKATGVGRLAAHLGVEREAVVAFGDMPNDVPLLSWAGLGVAVANAHREVRAVADEVTASNDEDGVAVVLDRLCRLHETGNG
jgi:Cof subfamily protein (haloacid dehalogenase superfamily)